MTKEIKLPEMYEWMHCVSSDMQSDITAYATEAVEADRAERQREAIRECEDSQARQSQAPQQAKPADQSCYCLNCEALGKELAALKAAPPQEPDRLHTAVMNLARKQADRIEELEAKLARGTPPPAQPLTEEQERKAFEGWVGRLMFCSESDLVHHALTGYGDLQLNSMWVGWRGQKIYTPPATPAEALAAVEAGVAAESQPAEPMSCNQEWQPIDTAPKDGRRLLLATPRGKMADGNRGKRTKYGRGPT